MKGFILASFFSIAYAIIVLAFFRISMPERRAVLMMRIFLLSIPILAVCLFVTPSNLWVLPESLTESNRWLDALFGLFAYSASILGGWLQLYNIADRGLSLRILIDALDAPGKVVSPDHLTSAYGGGKGMRWMYEKRLSDLLRLGLVRSEGDSLALTERGRRNAALILWLRRQFNIATRPDISR